MSKKPYLPYCKRNSSKNNYMYLKQAYPRDPNISEELRNAAKIAEELDEFDYAFKEDIERVLNKIPQSPNYFVYLTEGKYGTEIHILYAVDTLLESES